MQSSPDLIEPRVGVIVLNWNGFVDTCDAVDSLLAQDWQILEVHLVDNGSACDEGERLERRYHDRVRIHRNATNLGFAAAHNRVLKELIEDSRLRYVALLNNDALADPDWIRRLVEAAESDPGIGACASLMVFKQRPDIVENAGVEVLRTGEAIPRGRSQPASAFRRAVDLLGVCGGAALFRCEALRRAGLFRDEFFLNFEDVDLSLRLHALGWRNRFVPTARVLHGLSQSIDKVRDLEFRVRSIRNMGFAYLANMPWPALLLALPWLAIGWFVAPLACVLVGQFGYARVLVAGRLRLIRQGGELLAARRALRRHRRGSWWRTWRMHGSSLQAYARFLRDVTLLRRRAPFR